ncbi:MAG TPA: hypothetical protein VEI03_09100 [Stellaceae bacterium]|nr:hypothetical protein [Stellaceae bacterium]
MRGGARGDGAVEPGDRLSAGGLSALLGAALLAGCGIFSSATPTIKSRSVEIEVAQGANQDSPIAIDIVYVYDPQLVTQLTQMTAHDWFLKRGQIRQAFPSGFDLTSFELVPGQKGPVETIPSASTDAIAAFVFADYAADGTHRARIDAIEHVLIALGDKDFVVQPPRAAAK